MLEAVRTTASPAMIWTIVVVMSIFTAILVAATAVADAVQRRQVRRQYMMLRRAPGPVRVGAGGTVSDAAVGAGEPEPAAAGLPSQRTPEDMTSGQRGSRRPDAEPEGMPAAGAERMDPVNPVPAQRRDAARQAGPAAGQPPVPDPAEAPTQPMPAQRTGESDRAERSFAGLANPDPEVPDSDDPNQP
jgi:hypothetical protein